MKTRRWWQRRCVSVGPTFGLRCIGPRKHDGYHRSERGTKWRAGYSSAWSDRIDFKVPMTRG